MIVFSIDGRAYNLPVVKFELSTEILDGEGSGRMQTWEMFREPMGLIKNIEMEVGLTNASDNPDFLQLIDALDSFGTVPFRTVAFLTPRGLISQEMYGASYKISAVRFSRGGVSYWGSVPVKFVAKGPKR